MSEPKCKVKKCTTKDGQVAIACVNAKDGCRGFIHSNCSTLLLNLYDIPSEERPSAPGVVFCTETCFLKWRSKSNKQKKTDAAAKKEASKGKQKIAWEKDGSLRC